MDVRGCGLGNSNLGSLTGQLQGREPTFQGHLGEVGVPQGAAPCKPWTPGAHEGSPGPDIQTHPGSCSAVAGSVCPGLEPQEPRAMFTVTTVEVA